MRTRLVAVLSSFAAVLATAFLAPAATASPDAGGSTATPGPLKYVAMGDSYSAATGVLPLAPFAPPQCLRSTRNYPNVIASRTGAKLRDVTCGGADTGDYRASQSPGVAPQLAALRPDTELVTMTIGGNDSGVFINAIARCGAEGLRTVGRGNPCERRYGSSFEDTITSTTFPSLVQALNDVRAASPQAEVAILGYPWIVPTSGKCFPQLPVATGDVPYLRSLQSTLNDAVRRAAEATGSTYVDLSAVSEGRDACKPLGVRWVEPVVGTTNPVIVHPNARGERGMADETMRVLGLG